MNRRVLYTYIIISWIICFKYITCHFQKFVGFEGIIMMKRNERAKILQNYNNYIVTTCAVGLLLSAYAYYVEVSAESNHEYNAFCDISEHISCTKVFTSE